MKNHLEIRELQRQGREMRDRIKALPVRDLNRAIRNAELIVVGAGNNINVSGAGLTWPGLLGLFSTTPNPITSVPTLVPTASDYASGTFTDGLCAARINTSSTYVWLASVANAGAGNQYDFLGSIENGALISSRSSILLPVGATSVMARVYFPWLTS